MTLQDLDEVWGIGSTMVYVGIRVDGNNSGAYKQFGNAVTVNVARAVAEEIKEIADELQ